MDMLLLLVLLVLLIAPSFFMMRKERRRRNELQQMQSELAVGDRVVTAAGVHGHIVSIDDTEVALELAPGVVTTWDRVAILRTVEEQYPKLMDADTAAGAGAVSEELPEIETDDAAATERSKEHKED